MRNKRNYEGEEKGNRNEKDKRMNRRRKGVLAKRRKNMTTVAGLRVKGRR